MAYLLDLDELIARGRLEVDAIKARNTDETLAAFEIISLCVKTAYALGDTELYSLIFDEVKDGTNMS